MNDKQGYRVCPRCLIRLDLGDEVLCASCAEIKEKEKRAKKQDEPM